MTTDEWLVSLEDGTAVARDGTDLRAIGKAVLEAERADAQLHTAVAAARANGRSWTEVAMVLGVSREAARQRFEPFEG